VPVEKIEKKLGQPLSEDVRAPDGCAATIIKAWDISVLCHPDKDETELNYALSDKGLVAQIFDGSTEPPTAKHWCIAGKTPEWLAGQADFKETCMRLRAPLSPVSKLVFQGKPQVTPKKAVRSRRNVATG
jgi:hypothetical protein